MKKLIAVVMLLSLSAFAGDVHLLSRSGKAGFKAVKASAKVGAKVVNKARKQVL